MIYIAANQSRPQVLVYGPRNGSPKLWSHRVDGKQMHVYVHVCMGHGQSSRPLTRISYALAGVFILAYMYTYKEK